MKKPKVTKLKSALKVKKAPMLSAENSAFFSMLKGEGLINDEGCVGLKKKTQKKKQMPWVLN